MRITFFRVEGLRHAHEWEASDLGAHVVLPAAPAGMAIGDGIALMAGALGGPRTLAVLARCGATADDPELILDDRRFPEQVVGLDPVGVDALLDDESGRKVIVSARMTLDPPLFGQLREESMRDPKMLAALGEDPSVLVRVGWLFSQDLRAVSIGVLEVQVAQTAFPTGRSERPQWMDRLLRSIGERLGGMGGERTEAELAERLLTASLSPDPDMRRGFARVAESMIHPPFSLGRLELLRGVNGAAAAFGDGLVRARQLGPRAVRALRLAEAALIRCPDVLVVEDSAAAPWSDWLVELTTGEDATLEQVWTLPAEAVG